MVADGSVICWGGGEHGQLGRGDQCKVLLPTDCTESIVETVHANELYQISCGASHSICVSKNGVYVWGNGNSGQLGTGSNDCRFVPHKLLLPFESDDIRGICCGRQHSVIWTRDGLCYGFGSNSYHQLPLSTQSNIVSQIVPRLLAPVQHNKVVQVACGARHTVFLYECGSVATVGENSYGQLGIGSRIPSGSPQVLTDLVNVRLIASGANHCMAVTETGELYCWGYGKAVGYKHKDIVRPSKKLTHYTNIIQLAGGSTHCLALTENGNVYSWGSGGEGQLGLGNDQLFVCKPVGLSEYLPGCKVCQIAASATLSAALTVDGLLYLWGYSHHSVYNHSDGAVFKPLLLDLTPTRLSQVACGDWHMMAITGPLPAAVQLNTARYSASFVVEDMGRLDTPSANNGKLQGFRSPALLEQAELGSEGEAVANALRSKNLADFYAPTPEVELPDHITGNFEQPNVVCKATLPDSILVAGCKLPAILDASAGTYELSEERAHASSRVTARSPQTSDVSLRAASLSSAPVWGGEADKVANLLPMVTITADQSRVTLVNTLNQSYDAKLNINKQSQSLIKTNPKPPSTPLMSTKHSGTSADSTSVIEVKLADCSCLGENTRNASASTSGVWNPHRNSIFSSNIFCDDKLDLDSGMNTKLIGFLDMSEVQMIDKPSSRVKAKEHKLADRHSLLYNKEMNLRNLRRDDGKETVNKCFSFQKANRRAQITKLVPRLSSEVTPLSGPQIHLQKPPTVLDTIQNGEKLVVTSSKSRPSLRNQYHSAPALFSNSGLVRKPIPRSIDLSTADFSKTIAKFVTK